MCFPLMTRKQKKTAEAAEYSTALPLSEAQKIKRHNRNVLKEYTEKQNYNTSITAALLRTISDCIWHETIRTDAYHKHPLRGNLKNRKPVHRYHFRRLCMINYVVYRVASTRLPCVPLITDIGTEEQNHKRKLHRSKGIKK